MKVVDIHPEELIDKLNAGSLSASERERLDLHLAQCSACRFEISVREDFEQDAPELEPRPQLSFGERERAPVAAPRAASPIRARRRRWPFVALVAAFVLCAGGATAAVVTGTVPAPSWLPWLPRTEVGESSAPVAAAKGKPKTKAAPVALAPVTAPSVAEPSVAFEPVASASVEAQPVAPKASPAHLAAPVALTAARAPAAAPFEPAPSEPLSRTESTPRVDPAAALFADANRARRDGNAERAIAMYRSLQARFPSSAESQLSRALLAQLLLERGSPEAALAGFDRYLADGAPVLGAEALVGRARALEQMGKPDQAIAAWQTVQNRFPGSVHARLAATRLAALGER